MMELEQPRPQSTAMTYDEVSMERSKSFVKALQVIFLCFFVVWAIELPYDGLY